MALQSRVTQTSGEEGGACDECLQQRQQPAPGISGCGETGADLDCLSQFENFTLLWDKAESSVDSQAVKRQALDDCKYQVTPHRSKEHPDHSHAHPHVPADVAWNGCIEM